MRRLATAALAMVWRISAPNLSPASVAHGKTGSEVVPSPVPAQTQVAEAVCRGYAELVLERNRDRLRGGDVGCLPLGGAFAGGEPHPMIRRAALSMIWARVPVL